MSHYHFGLIFCTISLEDKYVRFTDRHGGRDSRADLGSYPRQEIIVCLNPMRPSTLQHGLAVPYRKLQIRLGLPEPEVSKDRQLAHILATKPAVASFVQHLMLVWDTEKYPETAELISSGTEPLSEAAAGLLEHSLFRDALIRAGASASGSKNWLEALSQNEADAWMALVLLTLPNLQHFGLIFPTGATYVETFVLGRISGLPPLTKQPSPLFSNLTSVYVGWHESFGGLDCSLILPLFRLPSMHELRADVLVGEFVISHPACPEPGSSSIEVIELMESNGMDGMLEILSLCANLRIFRYAHADGVTSGSDFDAEAFMEYIAVAKASLETLSVVYAMGHHSLGSGVEDAPFGPLSDFVKLKNLQIRDVNLIYQEDTLDGSGKAPALVELLPASLETLCLFEVLEPKSAADHLAGLVLVDRETGRLRLPHLREICIEGFEKSELPPQIQNSQVGCAESGITIRISCPPHDDRFHSL